MQKSVDMSKKYFYFSHQTTGHKCNQLFPICGCRARHTYLPLVIISSSRFHKYKRNICCDAVFSSLVICFVFRFDIAAKCFVVRNIHVFRLKLLYFNSLYHFLHFNITTITTNQAGRSHWLWTVALNLNLSNRTSLNPITFKYEHTNCQEITERNSKQLEYVVSSKTNSIWNVPFRAKRKSQVKPTEPAKC